MEYHVISYSGARGEDLTDLITTIEGDLSLNSWTPISTSVLYNPTYGIYEAVVIYSSTSA